MAASRGHAQLRSLLSLCTIPTLLPRCPFVEQLAGRPDSTAPGVFLTHPTPSSLQNLSAPPLSASKALPPSPSHRARNKSIVRREPVTEQIKAMVSPSALSSRHHPLIPSQHHLSSRGKLTFSLLLEVLHVIGEAPVKVAVVASHHSPPFLAPW
jgi:hypothetical protein